MTTKLALGTAQFGFPYGISNKSGQVIRFEVKKILDFAVKNGINTLDTAASYGDSEFCIGEIGTSPFRVITKLPPFPRSGIEEADWCESLVHESLSKLKRESIDGLLLHRSRDLLGPSGKKIFKSLQRLKKENFVKKIGVSIYNPWELDETLAAYDIDIVQSPFSIMDRRLATSGWLKRLNDCGVEIHVRSIFLQGLMLIPPEEIPEQFMPWTPLFNSWHLWLKNNSVSPVEACLHFVASHQLIDRIVVGVESVVQLQELVRLAKKGRRIDIPGVFSEDESLINPSNWNLK